MLNAASGSASVPWKYVREFLDDSVDTKALIDGGLLAIHRMRVTNLRIHLAPVDAPRYEQLTGGPAPNDGFFGPPVFDSPFGRNRQFYFDHAVASAQGRRPHRLPSAAGVEPRDVQEAARAMWDFGMLVHRGPLTVPPDISDEGTVLQPAFAAAGGVDHVRFAELVVDKVTDRSTYLYGVWSTLGAARFIEEFLDSAAIASTSYSHVLDEALALLVDGDMLGVAMPAEVLTPLARHRLAVLQATKSAPQALNGHRCPNRACRMHGQPIPERQCPICFHYSPSTR